MGNGESTSRRISMQRSDEGTIQISENVMTRLQKLKVAPEEQENAVLLQPGERVVDENDLQLMLEKAFHQGVAQGSHRNEKAENSALEKIQQKMNKKVEEVENTWKSKLVEQEKHSKTQLESLYDKSNEDILELKKKLTERENLLNEAITKISEEKSELQRQSEAEIEKAGATLKKLQQEMNNKVEEVENTWKSNFVEQEEHSRIQLESLYDKSNEDILEMKKKLTEREELLNEAISKISEEKSELQRQSVAQSEKADATLEKLKQEMNDKVGEIENAWKSKLEEQEKHSKMELESLHVKGNEDISEMKKTLTEREELLNEAITKISEEKSALQKRVTLREEAIQEEFNRSAEDLNKKIRPLQQAPICGEIQLKVLECYRLNKQQPLKCAKEVKDFVDCVQSVRLNLIQKKLISRE